MEGLTIAIDGYSGCGKSTTAKGAAKALNYRFIDTGAMYRSVALFTIQNNLDADNPESITTQLDKIHIDFKYSTAEEQNHVYLNGKEVSDRIREKDVNELVSKVAAIKKVRTFLVDQQRKMGEKGSVVMDGRDIGTTVFPKADLKIFMEADLDTRTKRRVIEMQNQGLEVNFEEVEKNLSERDRIDSSREESPLKKADDATIIDTTHMNIEDQINKVVEMARKLEEQKVVKAYQEDKTKSK